MVVSLSMRDYEKLATLAASQHCSRPVAAKRLIKAQLAMIEIERREKVAKNQLGLFDSIQMDIFNNTSKTN